MLRDSTHKSSVVLFAFFFLTISMSAGFSSLDRATKKNVLFSLSDWNDRTTFAHINQSTRYISAAINAENPPPFYCDHRVKCRLNYAINFIKTIVIQDGNNNSPVAISSIIFLLKIP